MKISENVTDLFAAVSKMQGELTNASKSKKADQYKYADIAECINTAKEPLEKNGLSVIQMLGNDEKGTTLITILSHSSGQYIGSEFVIEKAVLHGGAGKNPAQTMGASITYMRRYAYAAIIGLAQEDEDAKDCRPDKKQVEKQPLLPDTPAYSRAVELYKTEGNLIKVKAKMIVTEGVEQQIIDDVNNG